MRLGDVRESTAALMLDMRLGARFGGDQDGPP